MGAGPGAVAVVGVVVAVLAAEAVLGVLVEAVLEEAAQAATGSRNAQAELCKQKNK